MKRIGKMSHRIKSMSLAFVLAFLQIAVSVFALTSPLRVYAGEQLGENNFDSGKGHPQQEEWILRLKTEYTV